MKTLALAGAVAAIALIPTGTASAAVCGDYSNQADAQRAADTRDADGDGIYCEALPCPCLKGDDGSTPKPTTSAPKRKTAKPVLTFRGRITSVTDGDTIRVRVFNAPKRFYKVRLIGIDTPETKRPGTPVQCGGPEATASMLRLAYTRPIDTDGDGLEDEPGGKPRRITLKTDPTQDRFDRYGRLLAYARTLTGRDLARAQLSRGWAKVYVYANTPFQHHASFKAAERRARKADRGVWDAC